MMVLGLDVNATRARAVQGPGGDFALGLPLDPPGAELPLILNLEPSTPEVGAAGLRLCRQQPHLVCQGFLPHVGAAGKSDAPVKRWRANRHNLDADEAMNYVWKRLAPACKQAGYVILGLPGYITPQQADHLRAQGAKHRIPLIASLPSPLAAALSAFADQVWFDSVLVLDVDDHALSLALIRAVEGQAHILDMASFRNLGYHFWRERLINALSDCCILQTRRDPRASPLAEQGLFEQLESLFDACHKGRMVQLGVQATQWYQNLVVQPEQTIEFCASLVRQVIHEVDTLWGSLSPEEIPGTVLLTSRCGKLPGLMPAMQAYVEDRQNQHNGPWKTLSMSDDFGDHLVGEHQGDPSNVVVLGPDAAARAAHTLATAIDRSECPRGHLELVAPLPSPPPVEAGPPRLRYQGQDFFLDVPNYFLGRQDGCHLVVNDPRHPEVAGRHCEIIFDHRTFILFNRSRESTLVNDCPITSSTVLRPGDWIRLGPEGPALRFLGQASNTRTFKTA